MTHDTRPPATPSKTAFSEGLSRLDADERRAFDRRLSSMMRFLDDDVADKTPAALRTGVSLRAFRAMSRADRLTVLQVAALGEVVAGRVSVRRSAPGVPRSTAALAPAAEPAAEQEAPRVVDGPAPAAPRWSVSCAGGCGEMLPARGPRAVVALCEADAGKRAAARRRALAESYERSAA